MLALIRKYLHLFVNCTYLNLCFIFNDHYLFYSLCFFPYFYKNLLLGMYFFNKQIILLSLIYFFFSKKFDFFFFFFRNQALSSLSALSAPRGLPLSVCLRGRSQEGPEWTNNLASGYKL